MEDLQESQQRSWGKNSVSSVNSMSTDQLPSLDSRGPGNIHEPDAEADNRKQVLQADTHTTGNVKPDPDLEGQVQVQVVISGGDGVEGREHERDGEAYYSDEGHDYDQYFHDENGEYEDQYFHDENGDEYEARDGSRRQGRRGRKQRGDRQVDDDQHAIVIVQ